MNTVVAFLEGVRVAGEADLPLHGGIKTFHCSVAILVKLSRIAR